MSPLEALEGSSPSNMKKKTKKKTPPVLFYVFSAHGWATQVKKGVGRYYVLDCKNILHKRLVAFHSYDGDFDGCSSAASWT